MDRSAAEQIIASIEELERLFEQAKDDPLSPAWREMQQRIAELQEQIERLNPPH